MGQKRSRRKEFFAKHPTCCFCGGVRPATVEDHIPSRSVFRARAWPEGYVFPACSTCNASTRNEENVIALLSRIYPDLSTQQDLQEFNEIAEGLQRNLPEVLRELTRSNEQIKKTKDAHQLTAEELKQVVVTGPLVERCIQRFGLRLTCALYYKHAERILPKESAIAVRFFTNLHFFKGQFPAELGRLLANGPALTRNGQALGEQFTYKFGITQDLGAAAFLSFFRQSFAIFSIAYEDRKKVPVVPEMTLLRPGRF